MVFYNGFNLLVDIILVAIVFPIAYRIGFSEGFRKAWNKFKPPF